MAEDQLIVRLARELYDLKDKLEKIHEYSDVIYNNCNQNIIIRDAIINIINLIDSEKIYEA